MKASVCVLFLSFLLFVACDYNEEDQYTSITQLALSVPGSFVADSVSLHEIRVEVPGVKFGPPVNVTLTTDWGTWSNREKEIMVRVSYDEELDRYTGAEWLRSDRTAGDFSIVVSAKEMYQKFEYTATALFPDRIYLIPDSISMMKVAGNKTVVRVQLFSDKGRPSYGLKVKFSATNGALLDPAEVYYSNEALKTTLILPYGLTENSVSVGLTLDEGANPVIYSATIHLN